MTRRLEPLGAHDLPGGLRLAVARSPFARLLGVSLLDELPEGHGLLFPRCRSVHTFGMRFPIDVVFLDRHGLVVRIDAAVPRRRHLSARGAHSVLETRAGEAGLFVAAGAGRVAARG